MCSGGTRDKCGHPKRVHGWPSSDIPRRLWEWAKDTSDCNCQPHRTLRPGTRQVEQSSYSTHLCNFVRRTRMPLPALVELVRGQTETDHRPNKCMIPEVIAQVCKDYPHLDKLQLIAAEGVRVEFTQDVLPQSCPPDNHGSATERVNILRKNARKEQDARRCFVLDLDLLSMWPEVFISPFGVVDKAGGGPLTTGRTIHDLSFPEGASINDFTDQDAIPRANYRHCDAVAAEILRCKQEYPDAEIKIMAGDVTSAFRNVSIHSRSVHRFAGRIEIENALVIELACPFGWTGSPGEYELSVERLRLSTVNRATGITQMTSSTTTG
ncbi:Secreted protein [Phytophthora megakarya]|uniref:Secreted protein n=1 Tax=Phytophthora megakarya TaxID=4795 RepID=A0A225UYH4_9STRA|nr:Secreted protein [Phytophthora megakarya]